MIFLFVKSESIVAFRNLRLGTLNMICSIVTVKDLRIIRKLGSDVS